MKHFCLLLCLFSLSASLLNAQNLCTGATTLPLNGTNVCATTNGATLQAGENIGPATSGGGCTANQSMWLVIYTDTNTAIELNIDITNGPNCLPAMNVYGPFATPTGNCLPGAGSVVLSRNTLSTTTNNVTGLANLQQNSYYLIQIIGRAGGGPGDGFSSYCINAEPAPCQCADACGPACGFTSPPSVATVTSTCQDYPFTPNLLQGESQTQCYTIQAINDTINFQVVASTSGCAGGTVTGITWQVYTTGVCTAPVLQGTNIAPQWTGMIVGQNYTVCYTPTSACTRITQYPYFVGAIPIVLPVEWLDVKAALQDATVDVQWVVMDQGNSAYYVIERSANAETWEEIGNISAAQTAPIGSDKWNANGTQASPLLPRFQVERLVGEPGADKIDAGELGDVRAYAFTDATPRYGRNLYRIRQVDQDGTETISQTVEAFFDAADAQPSLRFFPQPAQDLLNLEVATPNNLPLQLVMIDPTGRTVAQWHVAEPTRQTATGLEVGHLPAGLYTVQATQGEWQGAFRVILQ